MLASHTPGFTKKISVEFADDAGTNPVADQPLNVAPPVPGVKVQMTDDPCVTDVVALRLPGVHPTGAALTVTIAVTEPELSDVSSLYASSLKPSQRVPERVDAAE